MDFKHTYLGIEFGSTRIKAVLIDEKYDVIACGNHTWENTLCDGIWTYPQQEVVQGLQACYQALKEDVLQKYQSILQEVGGIGISAMMHGYLVIDNQDSLLTPFRTWRNTITKEASEQLTEVFSYHIPQRWSIAHLYQAVLYKESHVAQIAYQTTLAGYIHYLLTGKKVIGIGEASGMFPIDAKSKTYNVNMMNSFDQLVAHNNYPWKLKDILPRVLLAGEDGGKLTQDGAKLLDPKGDLKAGICLCPPEGDAQTGMVATNSIQPKSGNVSAGTSVFAMVVLKSELKQVYEAIDMVTTPEGNPVAMVHCNNGTSEINAWMNVFKEVLQKVDVSISEAKLYDVLFHEALQGDVNGGGLLACNYLSGEHITKFEVGCPMFVRSANGTFNLANFMLTQMYSAFATLRIGMDILYKEEHVEIEQMLAHGGFFTTPQVSQTIMAAVMRTSVHVMKTAKEGGAWGIAILAAYHAHHKKYVSLSKYLKRCVFVNSEVYTMKQNKQLEDGFDAYMEIFKAGLKVERVAVDQLPHAFLGTRKEKEGTNE